jgi:hypothetical protein
VKRERKFISGKGQYLSAAIPFLATEGLGSFSRSVAAPKDTAALLFMAIWANAAPDDIRAELGWDEKKYKAVQKRKIRAVARWKLQGKLK